MGKQGKSTGSVGAAWAIAVAGFVVAVPCAVRADDAALVRAPAFDAAAFQADREPRYAAVKARLPPQEPQLVEIKARTAEMVAAYVPPAGPALDHPPVIWQAVSPPALVFDIAIGPRMVVIPAGEYTMGSAVTEDHHRSDEVPRHRVRIEHAVAVSMFPITYGEYGYFIAQTMHKSASSCVTLEGGEFKEREGRDWLNPGFAQTGRSPATCIAFEDATAYAAWLSEKTGHTYRLLSEAEYEYANRAGSSTAYWWGESGSVACEFVNGFDQDAASSSSSTTANSCHDGHVFTAPLDQSKPNPFGLYDTTGNVASWTADCWNATYADAPADGSARTAGDCSSRVVRGGSWASSPGDLRSASRVKVPEGRAGAQQGWRLARVL